MAVDPDKSSYDLGETVTLTATADPGWIFSGWSDDHSGVSNPDTLVIDGDKSVTASFTDVVYSEDFESYAPGDDPVDWFDTARDNSLTQDDSLFEVFDL